MSRRSAKPRSQGRALIPGAFESSYTKPTTQYFSKKRIPGNSEPADAHALRLEHAHWPLIIMLLFSQMAAGIFLTAGGDGSRWRRSVSVLGAAPLATVAFLTLNAGLAASVFHLGRPLGAWRFFLGLRTSWMSREILAFGLFAGAAFVATALCWAVPGSTFRAGGLGRRCRDGPARGLHLCDDLRRHSTRFLGAPADSRAVLWHVDSPGRDGGRHGDELDGV